MGGGHHLPVGRSPRQVVPHRGDTVAIKRTAGQGLQRHGKRTRQMKRPVAVQHRTVRAGRVVQDVMRADVGGATEAKAVNQGRGEGIVGAHAYPDVDRGVLLGVQSQRSGQGEVGVPGHGLQVGIQHVKQQTGAVGLFIPTVQPTVPKQRVGRNGAGHPGAYRFKDVDLHPGVVNVPPVGLHVGVGKEGKTGFDGLAGKVGEVVGFEFKISLDGGAAAVWNP